jgi:hypothetical protein
VKQASVQPFVEPGLPVEFLRDPAADKDEIARAFAAGEKDGRRIGLRTQQCGTRPVIRAPGNSHGSPDETLPAALPIQIHPQVGWMYA